MKPYFTDDMVTLHLGDCLKVLAEQPDASVDAIVTDPPAGVSFMGRDWDSDRGGRDAWIRWLGDRMGEAYRVLKPGGHALVWALPRTSHWTAMALEDAGFEIRDCVVHLFGSGFPKSLDVSKAIDRRRDDRGAINEVTGWLAQQRDRAGLTNRDIDEAFGFHGMAGHWTAAPHLKIAQVPRWEQWERLRALLGCGDEMDAEVWRLNGRKGTPGEAWDQREVIGQRTTGIGTGRGSVAVIGDSDNRDVTAPATDDAARWEGWGTALKPGQEIWWLVRKPMTGTVAANVLEYGTGAINIDGCRVGTGDDRSSGGKQGSAPQPMSWGTSTGRERPTGGRWPTNVVFTHGACVEDGPCADGCPAAELDRQSGVLKSGVFAPHHADNGKASGTYGAMKGRTPGQTFGGDSGGASRFYPTFRYEAKAPTSERPRLADGTAWPTVKPLGLMRWLIRLITPPGGLVLDCFAGSGATAEAAVIEGFRCLLVERDLDAAELIRTRLSKPIQPTLGDIA